MVGKVYMSACTTVLCNVMYIVSMTGMIPCILSYMIRIQSCTLSPCMHSASYVCTVNYTCTHACVYHPCIQICVLSFVCVLPMSICVSMNVHVETVYFMYSFYTICVRACKHGSNVVPLYVHTLHVHHCVW